MPANALRGEVEARLHGRDYRLCLTLGALAELETAFKVDDLNALAGRFSNGRLSASDMTRIIGAGLRGAGHAIGDEEVAMMGHERGVAGMAEIVAALLGATFGTEAPANP